MIKRLQANEALKNEAISTELLEGPAALISLMKQLARGPRPLASEKITLSKILAAFPVFLEAFSEDMEFRRQFISAYEKNRLNAIVQYLEFGDLGGEEIATKETPTTTMESVRVAIIALLDTFYQLFAKSKIGRARGKFENQKAQFEKQKPRLESIIKAYTQKSSNLGYVKLLEGVARISIRDNRNQFTAEGLINITIDVEVGQTTIQHSYEINPAEQSIQYRSNASNPSVKYDKLSFDKMLDILEQEIDKNI